MTCHWGFQHHCLTRMFSKYVPMDASAHISCISSSLQKILVRAPAVATYYAMEAHAQEPHAKEGLNRLMLMTAETTSKRHLIQSSSVVWLIPNQQTITFS